MLRDKKELGGTGLFIPPVIFGTSCLGNLYEAIPGETKLEILRQCFLNVQPPVVLDTAGKYGAGLALEVIGKGIKELGVPPEKVIISNKLGWFRVPLKTKEPAFEPGVWEDINHDAQQKISRSGILECYSQGCDLLGGEYSPQMVSVHDPDEYLAGAESAGEKKLRWENIIEAYQGLRRLKRQGKVKAIGVGAKDWKIIRRIEKHIRLDWVMFACSLTIMHHPPELLAFIHKLASRGIGIINSAVFHSGFLTGGDYFDYRRINPSEPGCRKLLEWRSEFFSICEAFKVSPMAASVRFGISPPGVVSIALNTSKPGRIKQNVCSVTTKIPEEFWKAMKQRTLISEDYPYL